MGKILSVAALSFWCHISLPPFKPISSCSRFCFIDVMPRSQELFLPPGSIVLSGHNHCSRRDLLCLGTLGQALTFSEHQIPHF